MSFGYGSLAKPGRRDRLALTLVLAILAVGTPLSAPAQLIDCSGRSDGQNTYQVYVDELSFMRASLHDDPELELLMKNLSFKLDMNIREMILEDKEVPLSFAFCKERRPAGRATFTESLVDNMDNNWVILEVWGQLDAKEQDGEITGRTATIGYVLVPVFLDSVNADRPVGFQFVKYASGGDESDQIIDMLEQSVELKAFVAIGLGVNLLAEGMYDEAMGYLCRALVILETKPIKTAEAERVALADYVRVKAREVSAEARGPGSSYTPNGVLTLLDPEFPCGGQ